MKKSFSYCILRVVYYDVFIFTYIFPLKLPGNYYTLKELIFQLTSRKDWNQFVHVEYNNYKHFNFISVSNNMNYFSCCKISYCVCLGDVL